MGTARIGRFFGPIMLLWFVAIAVLGLRGIFGTPSVFLAFNPLYAIKFLGSNGLTSFLALGGVFLCVTGAEALYADMGHFGAKPIRLAWSGVVFPALVLNYAGQCGLLLSGGSAQDNIFYQLCPPALMIPFVGLATVATIIASQSIITGAFSMTRQAIRLGWLPRLRIVQTSAGRLWPDLCRGHQLAADGGHPVPGAVLQEIRQSRRRLWHRRFGDHADDLGAAVHRHARDLELEPVPQRRRGGAFVVVDGSFFLANMAKVWTAAMCRCCWRWRPTP